MSVLVTGAGLIGSETARLLAARGEEVVLIDIRPPHRPLAGVRFEQADITDAARVEALLRAHGVERIVHTAALLSTALRADPVAGLRVNLIGTAVLLELCRKLGLKRMVCISSATVLYAGFGHLGPAPIPEDSALRLVSDRPGSLYALTKITGEHLALLYRDLHGVDAVSLRLAAVVGGNAPGAGTSVPGRLFATLIAAARAGAPLRLEDPLLVWGGAEEFIDLRDCGRAAVAALDAPAPALGVYNIAHPGQWTLDAVIAEVARTHGPFTAEVLPPRTTGFAGFPHIRPAPSSLAAAETELGFTAAHDLGDTLRYWWG